MYLPNIIKIDENFIQLDLELTKSVLHCFSEKRCTVYTASTAGIPLDRFQRYRLLIYLLPEPVALP